MIIGGFSPQNNQEKVQWNPGGTDYRAQIQDVFVLSKAGGLSETQMEAFRHLYLFWAF